MNKTTQNIIAVPSFAGTGKTAIVHFLLAILLPTLEAKETVYIIVPSRSLRDDVVQSVEDEFKEEEL